MRSTFIPESSSSLTRPASVKISAQATSWSPRLWFSFLELAFACRSGAKGAAVLPGPHLQESRLRCAWDILGSSRTKLVSVKNLRQGPFLVSIAARDTSGQAAASARRRISGCCSLGSNIRGRGLGTIVFQTIREGSGTVRVPSGFGSGVRRGDARPDSQD